MPDDKMTEIEKKMFKGCIDSAFLAMDELRAELTLARDADDPMSHAATVLVKHNTAGEALNGIMGALGFDSEEDEDEYEYDDEE